TDTQSTLGRTLGRALDDVARLHGDKPAVFHLDETIVWRELQQRAEEAARALLAFGVKRGDRVGVLLGNQPEWQVMCFAASYVGATFVPLNTWYKRTELAWTIRHCQLTAVILAARFLNQDFAGLMQEMIPELASAPPGNLRSAEFPSLRVVGVLGSSMPGALGWQ